jgi:hypothetical protein
MIHAGPLYSALQARQIAATPIDAHQPHSGHDAQASSVHAHHQQHTGKEPPWLSELEMCGYCGLLTLNPPLTLSFDMVLPRHEPQQFMALPDAPLIRELRRSRGYARGPPSFHA